MSIDRKAILGQCKIVREKQRNCQKMMLDLATCEGMMICMSETCPQSQSKKQAIKNHKVKTQYLSTH